MRIIFIRHGEPDYSIDSLTEKGWREARLLAERTSKWDVSQFYCSPLGRAKATAKPTLEKMNRAAIEYPWLREFNAPVINPENGQERIPWDLKPGYWTNYNGFHDLEHWTELDLYQNSNVKIENERVCEGIDSILKEYGYIREGRMYKTVPRKGIVQKPEAHASYPILDGGDTIVIFCHLGVTCVMMAHLLNMTPLQVWHGMFLPTTSVSVLSTEEVVPGEAYFRAQMIGDTSHLRIAGEKVSYYGSFVEPFQG